MKSAIIGATDTAQLQEIVSASHTDITPEILDEINEVHERYPNPCP